MDEKVEAEDSTDKDEHEQQSFEPQKFVGWVGIWIVLILAVYGAFVPGNPFASVPLWEGALSTVLLVFGIALGTGVMVLPEG